jgi:hypothetical protein
MFYYKLRIPLSFGKMAIIGKKIDIDFVFSHDLSKAKGIKQMDLNQISANTINVKNFYFRIT